MGDAICQERFSVDLLCCLLRVEGEQRSLRMDDTTPDFHFLVFVHERFANIWIVTIANGRGADERRPVGNGLALKHACYFGRAIESSTVYIHFKDNRRSATTFSCFLGATDKH